jgi:hypothetical protein
MVLIVGSGLNLRGKRRPHEGQEISADERGQRRRGLFVSDSHFALSKCRAACGFHLFRDTLVCLFGALADWVTVPHKLEPPILTLVSFVDHVLYPLP